MTRKVKCPMISPKHCSIAIIFFSGRYLLMFSLTWNLMYNLLHHRSKLGMVALNRSCQPRLPANGNWIKIIRYTIQDLVKIVALCHHPFSIPQTQNTSSWRLFPLSHPAHRTFVTITTQKAEDPVTSACGLAPCNHRSSVSQSGSLSLSLSLSPTAAATKRSRVCALQWRCELPSLLPAPEAAEQRRFYTDHYKIAHNFTLVERRPLGAGLRDWVGATTLCFLTGICCE